MTVLIGIGVDALADTILELEGRSDVVDGVVVVTGLLVIANGGAVTDEWTSLAAESNASDVSDAMSVPTVSAPLLIPATLVGTSSGSEA